MAAAPCTDRLRPRALRRGGADPRRHVIHTVGPRFNAKYRSAAESALHNCYRASLELIKENQLSSIAFPAINSIRRGYPPEAGAHIALRTGVQCVRTPLTVPC